MHRISNGTAVIRIDGTITSNTYIRVGGEVKDGSEASRTIPTLLPGYYTYSSGGNIVYVKGRNLRAVLPSW